MCPTIARLVAAVVAIVANPTMCWFLFCTTTAVDDCVGRIVDDLSLARQKYRNNNSIVFPNNMPTCICWYCSGGGNSYDVVPGTMLVHERGSFDTNCRRTVLVVEWRNDCPGAPNNDISFITDIRRRTTWPEHLTQNYLPTLIGVHQRMWFTIGRACGDGTLVKQYGGFSGAAYQTREFLRGIPTKVYVSQEQCRTHPDLDRGYV